MPSITKLHQEMSCKRVCNCIFLLHDRSLQICVTQVIERAIAVILAGVKFVPFHSRRLEVCSNVAVYQYFSDIGHIMP